MNENRFILFLILENWTGSLKELTFGSHTLRFRVLKQPPSLKEAEALFMVKAKEAV
jgi:hypothetical protein